MTKNLLNENIILAGDFNFYMNDIHGLYMKYFKQEPTTIKDISNQSLWLNKYITIDNKIIHWIKWEKASIHRIGDIVNCNNVPLTHNEIVNKYNLKTTFLDSLQLLKSIPPIGSLQSRTETKFLI